MSAPSAPRPCVAFTGGGSGGHVYPGLAVIERLKREFRGRIIWIGSGKPVERDAVEAAGVEFFAVPSGKLRRSFSFENFVDAFRLVAGFFAARAILARERPLLLFSKGGYVSVAPCKAALSLGIPVFTHESDASPGLATRINARGSERIYAGFPSVAARLPAASRSRVVVSGNPVREGISGGDPVRGRAFLGLESGMPIVLVLGGSQGARSLNALVASVLPSLAGRAAVAHQTGPGNPPARADDAGYRSFEYIREELPDVIAAASLVVGRSGAGTVSECAAAGKPMILVPLTGGATRGDQVENAEAFARAGAAISLVGDAAAPEALAEAIVSLIADPARMRGMADAARRILPERAAELIARDIAARIGAHG